MADFNDNSDAFLLAALLMLSRDWLDLDPERWEFAASPIIERLIRRRRDLGPDLDILTDQHLRIPATDRMHPEESLVIDMFHQQSNLVTVPCQHNSR